MEIKSEIKGFEGTVYLPEFLTLPQVNAFSKALAQVSATPDIKVWERDEIMMPAVFACIERMEIHKQPEHPTLATFRFTPAPRANELISLLIVSVSNMVMGEQEIPND